MFDEQVNKLSALLDSVQKKGRILEIDKRLNQQVYYEITQQYAEIQAELQLFIQQQTTFEVGVVLDRVFQGLREICDTLFNIKRQTQSPSPQKISMQIPEFLNSISGLPVMSQTAGRSVYKTTGQIPWSDQKSKDSSPRVPKKFVEKGTSTFLDFQQNCMDAIGGQDDREEKVHQLLEYTDGTLQLMNEALQNRVHYEPGNKGDPKELTRIIEGFNSQRSEFESILRDTDFEALKTKAENFGSIQEKMRTHIKDVQKATAEVVFKYFTHRQQEKEKQSSILSGFKNKIKQKVFKPEECQRCQYYVGELMNAKQKMEQAIADQTRTALKLQDLQNQVRDKDLQLKLVETDFATTQKDKLDYKRKWDALVQQTKRQQNGGDKKSELLSPDDPTVVGPETKRQLSTYRKQSSSQNSSNILSPAQPQTNQEIINTYKRKEKLMERFISVVSVLDQQNQQRRLSQVNNILSSSQIQLGTQIIELDDLVREIEDNDLLLPDEAQRSSPTIGDITEQTFLRNGSIKIKVPREPSRQTIEVKQPSDSVPQQITLLQIPESAQSKSKMEPNQVQFKRRASFAPATQSNIRKRSEVSSHKIKEEKKQLDKLKVSTGESKSKHQTTKSLTSLKSTEIVNPYGYIQQPSTNEQQQLQVSENFDQMTKSQKQQYLLQNQNTYKYMEPEKQAEFLQQQEVFFRELDNPQRELYLLKEIMSRRDEGTSTQTEDFVKRQCQFFQNLSKEEQFEYVKTQAIQIFYKKTSAEHSSQTQHLNSEQAMQTDTQDFRFRTGYNDSLAPSEKFNSTFDIITDRASTGAQNAKLMTSLTNARTSPVSVPRNKLTSVQSESEYSEANMPKSQTQHKTTRFNSSQNSGDGKLHTSFGSPVAYMQRYQEEQVRKIKQEQLLFDKSLHELDEQEEHLIQKALSGQQNMRVGTDINEQVMKVMYANLLRDQRLMNLVKEHRGDSNPISLKDFQQFMTTYQKTHKRCGPDCVHLLRFYLRLGFLSIKYLKTRKILKMSKPTIAPFPKI